MPRSNKFSKEWVLQYIDIYKDSAVLWNKNLNGTEAEKDECKQNYLHK